MPDYPEDFGERRDEVPCYPSTSTPEWMRRLRYASWELRRAQAEIREHCAEINAITARLLITNS